MIFIIVCIRFCKIRQKIINLNNPHVCMCSFQLPGLKRPYQCTLVVMPQLPIVDWSMRCNGHPCTQYNMNIL